MKDVYTLTLELDGAVCRGFADRKAHPMEEEARRFALLNAVRRYGLVTEFVRTEDLAEGRKYNEDACSN